MALLLRMCIFVYIETIQFNQMSCKSIHADWNCGIESSSFEEWHTQDIDKFPLHSSYISPFFHCTSISEQLFSFVDVYECAVCMKNDLKISALFHMSNPIAFSAWASGWYAERLFSDAMRDVHWNVSALLLEMIVSNAGGRDVEYSQQSWWKFKNVLFVCCSCKFFIEK